MIARHAEALDALSDEKSLIAYVNQVRGLLRAEWTPARGGRPWGQSHADLLDLILKRIFTLAAERAAPDSLDTRTPGIALLATGGYGARVLAPHSDIDLTFLVDRDDDPAVLREAFRLVMDVLLAGAKIKVGYGYRHLSDIGAGGLDHQTQTALLDARFIAGDGSLFARFDRAYAARLHLADFLFSKEAERKRVRARAGETPFALEPDIKEGAGGLRDIQTALWMARARFDKAGDALWRDLVRRRILTRDEMRLLQDAREHLHRVRHCVHILAGERRDRLTIAWQEAAAERLGYIDAGDSPGVERFMRDHYAAADTIERLSEKIGQRCLDAPLALGQETGLSSLRRTVVLTDPKQAQADPLWPLAALEFCQRYNLELSSACVEEIETRVEADTIPDEAGSRFLEQLARPGNLEATVRRMRRTGLLRAILRELDDCMRLIPYDPAHIYTVGEHTLRVVDNLMRLHADAPAEPGLDGYRYVFSTLQSPRTLFLAALLHDLGKQWPRTLSGELAPHEITGAERARAICERLGCTPEMTARVVFLVRHHLLLAEVSRFRDLGRPETVRELARIVPDSDLLRMLYVLTWADTSAVGPGVWTAMTARLLEELFQRCEADLAEEPAEISDATRKIDLLRERLRKRLARGADGEAPPADPDAIASHIDAMPAAYLLNTGPAAMGLHLAMAASLLAGEAEHGVLSDLRAESPDSRETVLTLVAWDDPEPGLLAKVTGVLYAFDVRLHAAQVFTRTQPGQRALVIDTLTLDYRDRPLERGLRIDVATALERVLSGVETLPDLLSRKRRPEPVLGKPRAIELIVAQGDDTLLLEITIGLGSGAIHALMNAITGAGWNIHAARLSVWVGQVRCAVYVSDAALGGVGDDTSQQRLRAAVGA